MIDIEKEREAFEEAYSLAHLKSTHQHSKNMLMEVTTMVLFVLHGDGGKPLPYVQKQNSMGAWWCQRIRLKSGGKMQRSLKTSLLTLKICILSLMVLRMATS